MPRRDTKEQILDAAEHLFAERGYAGTSMRAITEAARVNLAAVNYHFGSKDQLLCAVVARRVIPVNAERLRLLDELETRAAPAPPDVEAVLLAYVAPVFRDSAGQGLNDAFVRLLGRLYSEPLESITVLYEAEFAEVIERFTTALARALPDLPQEDVCWRLEFILGILTHTLMAGDRLHVCTGGLPADAAVDTIIAQMIRFAAAGMRAPAA